MLYLIPTTLADDSLSMVIPQGVKEKLASIKFFVVEDLRTARRFLKACGYPHDFEHVTFEELNEHNESDPMFIYQLMGRIKAAGTVGLISDAGAPAVADPGKNLVLAAHQNGIQVVPLTGPSSILLALMASGLNGQKFSFEGYLPKDQIPRRKRLKEMENESLSRRETKIFIETPYRNNHVISDVLQVCSPEVKFCIASNLTATTEKVITKTVEQWKREIPQPGKIPCVFLLQK